MTESQYQTKLLKRLRDMFPGCELIRGDAGLQQGMLDWFILWGPYWASLEIKASALASTQPNQDYYVQKLDDMSFAAYIYPENEEEVLCALEQAFKPPRRTRILKS